MANTRYIAYFEINSVVNTYIGSKACEKVSDLITNKQLLADVRKLSSHHQTSSFESYHSVVNHFAPKLLAFSYVGIYCRYKSDCHYV